MMCLGVMVCDHEVWSSCGREVWGGDGVSLVIVPCLDVLVWSWRGNKKERKRESRGEE